ncbi:hypothetical protein D3C75_1106350 [compost metagenome]
MDESGVTSGNSVFSQYVQSLITPLVWYAWGEVSLCYSTVRVQARPSYLLFIGQVTQGNSHKSINKDAPAKLAGALFVSI